MNRFDPVSAPFRMPNLGGNGLGQASSYVEGSVQEAKTGRGIPAALVTVTHKGRTTTVRTNQDGDFAVNIPVDPGQQVEVSASAAGFATKTNPSVVAMPTQGTGWQSFMLEKAAVSPALVGAGLLAVFGIGYVLFS